jgi:hypothetical protein
VVRPDDQVQRVVAISGDSRKTLANFFRLQVWPMSRSIRTAIATMAFGFLIERFDLFIRFAASKLDVSAESAQRAQLCRPGRVWVGRPRNGDDRGFRIAVLQDSETDRFGCR